ncbi:MAG: sulfatase-like hydrolase/transferase, partial [Bacteroidales bacterium]|nr:sulfatase-like hydrolase/transferase [Bacteroidales bacterium]
MKMNIYSCSSLALLGIVAGCTSGGGMKKTPEGNSPKRPNVLVILADDQRADALGCSGNPYIKTPNIDSLADTGLRFTNAYIMGGHHGAISAPSRAMLMSGLYLFNVYDKLEGVNTMPAHFGKEAYVTFGTGKWHNGAGTFEASFQNGKDVFLGGMSDHFNVPCRELSAEGKLSDPVKKGFSTDVFSEAAIDFLEEYGEGSMDKPFFCY